jgi:hypothetical protein
MFGPTPSDSLWDAVSADVQRTLQQAKQPVKTVDDWKNVRDENYPTVEDENNHILHGKKPRGQN